MFSSAFADHYEPLRGKAYRHQGLERVKRWFESYPPMVDRFHDAGGRPPQHTFFYPAEEYAPEYADLLAQLCQRGYGEVEIHLRHDRDKTPHTEDSERTSWCRVPARGCE
jgi:hypothetical protein